MHVQIDEERLRESFEQYSAVGETADGGLHRLALSAADGAVRDRFVSDLRALDVEVRVDEVGNVFGRQRGSFADEDPVLVGSHLDSQPYGGRYDGQLGVLVALEVLRALETQERDQHRPLEIVNWTNEEGARFNLAPLGSGVFTGNYDLSEALAATDDEGVTVETALAETGYDGEFPCEPHDIAAHLELHIEQGPRLVEAGVPVGIVEGVVGMSWFQVQISGAANHAGTTPMHARQDALAAAASAIDTLQTVPAEFRTDVTLTVGSLDVEPGAINVVPGAVEFTVDLRSPDDETRHAARTAVERVLDHVTARTDTSYSFEEVFSTDATTFSPAVLERLEDACVETDTPFERMTSGAGHDAMYLDAVTDTGMLFVPSVGGISHREDEYTEWEDVLTGARIFARASEQLLRQ